jgi:L-threonylcarbamoyladenylate synthase
LSASDRRLTVDPPRVTPATLAPAAAWLMSGGIVAYPTDTFYGLAVDPGSAEALRDLFDLKGRDPAMAVPLIASSREQVEQAFGPIAGTSARLASAFWPGPLSLILDAPAWVTTAVHGRRGGPRAGRGIRASPHGHKRQSERRATGGRRRGAGVARC